MTVPQPLPDLVPSSVPDLDAARRLLAFCDASPSPYHACATAAATLGDIGFTRLAEQSTTTSSRPS